MLSAILFKTFLHNKLKSLKVSGRDLNNFIKNTNLLLKKIDLVLMEGGVLEKADPGHLSESLGLAVQGVNQRTDLLNGTRVDAYLQYSEVRMLKGQ